MKSNQNWRFYDVFSMELFSLWKNSFFFRKWLTKCEGFVRIIPMSSDIVIHNVSGILLTLWLTLWENCEWRWIPLIGLLRWNHLLTFSLYWSLWLSIKRDDQITTCLKFHIESNVWENLWWISGNVCLWKFWHCQSN